jgi:hypothetical protein
MQLVLPGKQISYDPLMTKKEVKYWAESREYAVIRGI